jgi:hypothetical protein
MARIFLAIVGAAYILLAAWCSLMPDKTSKAVCFSLQPGSGQSEFLTVYGGLELALGIAFLWPLYRPAEVAFPLFLCLLIHGCLVAFRTAGFVFYSGIPTTTYALAATEWIIFIGAASLFWGKR